MGLASIASLPAFSTAGLPAAGRFDGAREQARVLARAVGRLGDVGGDVVEGGAAGEVLGHHAFGIGIA